MHTNRCLRIAIRSSRPPYHKHTHDAILVFLETGSCFMTDLQVTFYAPLNAQMH